MTGHAWPLGTTEHVYSLALTGQVRSLAMTEYNNDIYTFLYQKYTQQNKHYFIQGPP
jgi:hypothetical protein